MYLNVFVYKMFHAAAAALGISLVIVLDCMMTFLGSMANDAAFNAWMTDWGDGRFFCRSSGASPALCRGMYLDNTRATATGSVGTLKS